MKHVNGSRTRHANPMEMVRDDITAIKKDLAAVMNGHISSVSDRAKEVVSKAGDGARELVEHTKEQAIAKHKKLGSFTGHRPITTIVLASAAGAIAAALVGRMGRRGE